MKFKAHEYLQKLRQKAQAHTTHTLSIQEILREYIDDINSSHFSFRQGNLYLKNLSPLKKTHIKLSRESIKKKAIEKGIHIRDII